MRKILLALMITICVVFVNNCFAQEEEESIFPKKVEVDSDYDGEIDRVEYYDDNGQVAKIEMDSTGDGKINEWIIYKDGKPLESQRDSNADGKPDLWMKY